MEKVAQWCQGFVVAVKTRNRVHIQWNADCLREGGIPISEEVLMKSKYNRHVEGGWRMSLGKYFDISYTKKYIMSFSYRNMSFSYFNLKSMRQ